MWSITINTSYFSLGATIPEPEKKSTPEPEPEPEKPQENDKKEVTIYEIHFLLLIQIFP